VLAGEELVDCNMHSSMKGVHDIGSNLDCKDKFGLSKHWWRTLEQCHELMKVKVGIITVVIRFVVR
jgi:hypothetical protein